MCLRDRATVRKNGLTTEKFVGWKVVTFDRDHREDPGYLRSYFRDDFRWKVGTVRRQAIGKRKIWALGPRASDVQYPPGIHVYTKKPHRRRHYVTGKTSSPTVLLRVTYAGSDVVATGNDFSPNGQHKLNTHVVKKVHVSEKDYEAALSYGNERWRP